MNRSYRKAIWNESLGVWVAASEITTARGKKAQEHHRGGRGRLGVHGFGAGVCADLHERVRDGGGGTGEQCVPGANNGLILIANNDSIASGEDLVLRGGGSGVGVRDYFRGNNDGTGTVISIGNPGTISTNSNLIYGITRNVQSELLCGVPRHGHDHQRRHLQFQVFPRQQLRCSCGRDRHR